MMSINDIKNGMIIELENSLYQVIEFLHVKPGKGGAIMKTKLKNIRTGTTLEKNFNPNIKCKEIKLDRVKVQFLYAADKIYYFMDTITFEQFELSADQLGHKKDYLIEGNVLDIAKYNNELIEVSLPDKIEFTITKCDVGVRGNTQSSATKDAFMETGLLVKVPLFIKEGEKIIVSTPTGKYYSRA